MDFRGASLTPPAPPPPRRIVEQKKFSVLLAVGLSTKGKEIVDSFLADFLLLLLRKCSQSLKNYPRIQIVNCVSLYEILLV